MKKMWAKIIILGGILMLATIGFSQGGSNHEKNSSLTKSLQFSDVRALDFTIQMINETEIYMSELYGDIILLDFMATYCLNCLIQIDILRSIYQRFERILIVTVSVSQADSIEILNQYAQDYEISWIIGRDLYQEAVSVFNVTIIPTVVLINQHGIIQYYNKGVVLEPQLEDWIMSIGDSSSVTKVFDTTVDSDLTSSVSIPQTSPSFTLLMTAAFLHIMIFIHHIHQKKNY
ncbi:MAG: TlpA family protein disulfide reductase [Candidatus Hermodarchaeota archaeon]